MSWALLIVDNAPLQAGAWRELGLARRRLEKATRDLHRHENEDVPGFRTWLSQTFPREMTRLRDLAERVERLEQTVGQVKQAAFFTGRSERAIWREMQRPPAPETSPGEEAAGDPAADPAHAAAGGESDHARGGWDDDPADDFFGQGELFESLFAPRPSEAEAVDEGRATYRRMANVLHPDRGGEWTEVREALWHEVQRAWAARDADWLMRLEAEWEMRTEVLGPQSAVSRLRRAREEVEAARRDADRKLREYRRDVAWRFSVKRRTEAFERTVERGMRDDLRQLESNAAYLEQQVAAWERPTKPKRKSRARR